MISSKQAWKLVWIFTLAYGFAPDLFADTVDDPCGGPSALLNIIDRPTVADSACVVPYKKVVLETGYQYQQLTHSAGNEQNFPEAELRIGLPIKNEFVAVLPNYVHQSMSSQSGFMATTLGIKHEIGYTEHWLGAIESLFTLPDGNAAFGSKGVGVALNGIVAYTFNPQYNLSLMLGGTSQTQPSNAGGQRYTSINPDLVFTYTATDKLEVYGEIYGQSKTGPGEGSGFNFDGGILYLLLPIVAVDVEIGQRISGNLDGFQHYVGAGLSVMFG